MFVFIVTLPDVLCLVNENFQINKHNVMCVTVHVK